MESQILELLEFIKQKMQYMRLDAEEVFLNGNCGNLFYIFSKEFRGKAEPYRIYYDGIPYHTVTKIGEDFYDITGKTDIKRYCEYLREHNGDKYREEKFSIRKISILDVEEQCNKYRYNEAYEQSETEQEMFKLDRELEKRRRDRDERKVNFKIRCFNNI